MVSLLYSPRLFVYHSKLSKTSSTYKLFLRMEVRLIKIIAIPGMFLTFLLAILFLNFQDNLIFENHFIVKLSFVLLLAIFQIYLIVVYLALKKRQNNKSGKFYKFINEIPYLYDHYNFICCA